mmetsp:Transcript_25906/g.102141  ORF Transcript_25906/g.102141 Transcript_25906/m.102141 type:complete len:209 (+) Transcript_25906:2601-3227(+)
MVNGGLTLLPLSSLHRNCSFFLSTYSCNLETESAECSFAGRVSRTLALAEDTAMFGPPDARLTGAELIALSPRSFSIARCDALCFASFLDVSLADARGKPSNSIVTTKPPVVAASCTSSNLKPSFLFDFCANSFRAEVGFACFENVSPRITSAVFTGGDFFLRIVRSWSTCVVAAVVCSSPSSPAEGISTTTFFRSLLGLFFPAPLRA